MHRAISFSYRMIIPIASKAFILQHRCDSSWTQPTVGKPCELNLHVAVTSLHQHVHHLHGTLQRPSQQLYGEDENLTLKVIRQKF